MPTRTLTTSTKATTTPSTDPLTPLRERYTKLTRCTLPSLASSRSIAQITWPVHLDHCFMRIILDNAVGVTKPWGDVVKAPATKNMSREQLEKAVELGERIERGEISLVELDERSLALRGKVKGGGKRKVGDVKDEEDAVVGGRDGKEGKKRRTDAMADIWSTFTAVKKEGDADDAKISTQEKSHEKKQIKTGETHLSQARHLILANKSMTPFRKRVLLLLTQVPRGQYTTYKAMAAGMSRISPTTPNLKSDTKPPPAACARAIGSAMRNNPFAPTVPCHRVLAADGRIGGFGGDWGEEGRFVGEKRRLLREEGVRFDGKGKVVGAPWEGFVGSWAVGRVLG